MGDERELQLLWRPTRAMRGKSGAVEVIKDGEKIANVSAPGSVFGEQAILLDQPHTADVRTLEQSEFYVADAQAMLAGDPTVAIYVAAILARRLDAANRSLIEVKHQLQAGESLSVIGKTVEKVEELLSYCGGAAHAQRAAMLPQLRREA